jgi:Xaa-Pro aminopeptidase
MLANINKRVSTVTLVVIAVLISSWNVSLLAKTFDFTAQSPWPEIRKERLQTLLPQAMDTTKIDAWLIICRENDNDPLAPHVGCENAGKTAVFLFYFDKQGGKKRFVSKAFSPNGEATALADINLLDVVIPVARNQDAVEVAVDFIKQQDFTSIAINRSSKNAQADGLSSTQYEKLSTLLGSSFTARLTSSEKLVYEYLAIKLPSEVEIMRQAAALTAKWQIEAYQQIEVGKTTDADVARFLKQKMREYGVTDAWAPDQNPNVVSGTDRGHSHATNRVIQAGDVIQTDFGIRVYDRWVTDIQRFAYVLKANETSPPKDIMHYWESAKKGREAAFGAMKPGNTGQQVDKAQRIVMQETNSLPVMWSTGHPVGYVAHDSGPSFSGGNGKPREASLFPLKEGMTFAFDGFHSWIMPNGLPKTISVEEMVVITPAGAEYLIPAQQDLVLVK